MKVMTGKLHGVCTSNRRACATCLSLYLSLSDKNYKNPFRYVACAWRDCFSIVTVDDNNPGDTEQFSLFENSSNGEGSAIQVEEKIL